MVERKRYKLFDLWRGALRAVRSQLLRQVRSGKVFPRPSDVLFHVPRGHALVERVQELLRVPRGYVLHIIVRVLLRLQRWQLFRRREQLVYSM